MKLRPIRGLVGVLALAVVSACTDPDTTFRVEHCVAPSAPARLAEEVTERQLRVVSVNMWGISFVSRYIEERFTALAERLRADRSVDVVGLQEAWDGSAREDLLARLRDTFPYQVDFHGEHGRSGLALLSRRPFVGEPRFQPFEHVGKWWKPWNGEWLGGKGVGAARVALADGTEVWVAVTHLHACYDPGAPLACDEGDEFAAFRHRQLEQVRTFVNDIAGDETAVVLGDFNFTPTSTYFRDLRQPREGNGFDPGWIPVPEPEAPPTRIDHVWLRPGATEPLDVLRPAAVAYADPVRVDAGVEVPLSDHCAIAATVGR